MSIAEFTLRRALFVLVVAVLAGSLIVATSGDRARSSPLIQAAGKKMYTASAVLSRRKTECAAGKGLFIGLQTKRRVRTPLSTLGNFARNNKPKSAVATINGKRFRLRIDGTSSGYGFRQVWWGFRVAKFTGKAPKRFGLSYRLAGRAVSTTVRVSPSVCD